MMLAVVTRLRFDGPEAAEAELAEQFAEPPVRFSGTVVLARTF